MTGFSDLPETEVGTATARERFTAFFTTPPPLRPFNREERDGHFFTTQKWELSWIATVFWMRMTSFL
jgi:hypothetical protein